MTISSPGDLMSILELEELSDIAELLNSPCTYMNMNAAHVDGLQDYASTHLRRVLYTLNFLVILLLMRTTASGV